VLSAVIQLIVHKNENMLRSFSQFNWSVIQKEMRKDFLKVIKNIGEDLSKPNPVYSDIITETCKKYILDTFFEIDEEERKIQGAN